MVKFLFIRGLALRGKNELIDSPRNGNYLGILELLSEYNAFLAEHTLVHANKGHGHHSYLSSTVCKETIELMGQKVLSIIVHDIKSAKYFSTPDIAHLDLLKVVIN